MPSKTKKLKKEKAPKDTDKKKPKHDKKDRNAPLAREYTINLRKRLHKVNFKKRAPRAIKEIKAFAGKAMGTKDVRVTVGLNKFIWSQGIKRVPGRVRVKIARRKNDDQNSKLKMYTLVAHVPVTSYKGTVTKTVEDEDCQSVPTFTKERTQTSTYLFGSPPDPKQKCTQQQNSTQMSTSPGPFTNTVLLIPRPCQASWTSTVQSLLILHVQLEWILT
jgi:large subunit ribosomal protein L31e